MLDAAFLCVAFGPLAIYLLIMGLVNLRRRPWFVSGAFDLALLAAGVGGLATVGPLRLFLPERAAREFGPKAWFLMAALYLLIVVLVALVARPRLVIYNLSATELRPLLTRIAAELDPQAAWAGGTLALPELGLEVATEEFRSFKNVSLIVGGESPNLVAWRKFCKALTPALRAAHTNRNPRGAALALAGLAILSLIVYKGAEDPQMLAHRIRDLFEF